MTVKNLNNSLAGFGWLLIFLLMIVGFVHSCTGQSYVFTQASRPVNAGNFACTNAYTIQFSFAANSQFHLNRSVVFFEWGNQKLSIQYPYLTYSGYSTALDQMVGYSLLADGNTHTITCRTGNGTQQLLIDSTIIISRPYTLSPINSALWLSSSSEIDKLAGTITNLQYSPSLVYHKGEKEMPAPVYDRRNFPAGYLPGDFDSVASCYQQLVNYPAPKYAPGVYPKIHPMFDFLKAGGEDFLTEYKIDIDSAIRAGVAIAKILCDKFNCDLRVIGNTEDYYSYRNQPGSPHGKFNNAMIALANANPTYELRVDCSLSQLNGVPGYPTITTAQAAALLPNAPLTTYDNMAYILYTHYSDIQSKLNRPIKYAMIDNEFLPGRKFLDSAIYAANPECLAAKNASGLTWREYCSQQYTNALNRIYDGIRRACPGIKILEYDVNNQDECKDRYYDAQGKYRIGLNTDALFSDQLYPRRPIWTLLNGGGGDYRSLFDHMLSKRGQVKLGYKHSTPFLGMGYKGDPLTDINPTYQIGIATFVIGTGSPSLYPALYVQGTNPNPKSYACQMAYASYAQAACSKIWDIVMDGDLLPGDRNSAWNCFGGTNYMFWAGDYETLVAVKKLGSRYGIFCLRGTNSNLKTKVPYKREGTINLNSKSININARLQCSVFEYDETKPYQPDQNNANANPRMINQWVKFGDANNWTNEN